ncbi:MAG: DUF126 domain-containing protein [Lachnospiraceae bacterium]|nr:DUF126 domain-containing protein [Lachnospiraceae bacterium]
MKWIGGVRTRTKSIKNHKKSLQSRQVCGKLLMLRTKRWSSGTSHVLRTSKEQGGKTNE